LLLNGLLSLSTRRGEGPVLGGSRVPVFVDVRDAASGPEHGLSGSHFHAVLGAS